MHEKQNYITVVPKAE